MKTSVLDFIDSQTLREHLRNQNLEPAVECVLIVHCRSRSIEEKIAALKERYEVYSTEDFKKGEYHCREKNYKSALKEYIDSTEKVIADMYLEEDGYIYLVFSEDDAGLQGIFDTFDHALNAITKDHPGTEFCIRKSRINEFENITQTTALTNELGSPYDIWNLDNDRISWSLYSSYAWIPHRYVAGNLLYFSADNTFAVVVDQGKCPSNTCDLEVNDMTLKCVTFERNAYHPCGGLYLQNDFPILRIESAKASELDKCPKELIRFGHLVKGGISEAQFMTEYSQGLIGSL